MTRSKNRDKRKDLRLTRNRPFANRLMNRLVQSNLKKCLRKPLRCTTPSDTCSQSGYTKNLWATLRNTSLLISTKSNLRAAKLTF